MEQEEQKLNSLPDNAYRELKPGEVYKPIMPANSKPREVTTYSVVFGIIMAIVFSAAAAGTEGGTGVRGCYPDRYYRGWMRKSDEKE